MLIRIGGDHTGDKIPLETVHHALRNDVVHLLVVHGQGVVVGLDECRLMFVVAFWGWDIKQHRGVSSMHVFAWAPLELYESLVAVLHLFL